MTIKMQGTSICLNLFLIACALILYLFLQRSTVIVNIVNLHCFMDHIISTKFNSACRIIAYCTNNVIKQIRDIMKSIQLQQNIQCPCAEHEHCLDNHMVSDFSVACTELPSCKFIKRFGSLTVQSNNSYHTPPTPNI